MKKRIGIVILATNAYIVLGVRFMKRFKHFYKGDCEITFYVFSNEDPKEYLPDDIDVRYYNQNHSNWREGTNSKFKNIVNIQYDLIRDVDYVFYFDADTNIDKDFTEEWFLGDYVAGEHYGNRDWLSEGQGFNRVPGGRDYVPIESTLPYTYRYGAFFGGSTSKMLYICETLMKYQIIDQDRGYEPPNNDEGYLNAYFHFNTPTYTVPTEKFAFLISDKGGYEEYVRHPNVNLDDLKKDLIKNKNKLFNLIHREVVYE